MNGDRGFGALAQTVLRVVAGLVYFSHGSQKLLGWFGGFGPNGGTAELMSRFGFAGAFETVVGGCLIVGFLTRPLAFLASGEMAVAYFWIQTGGSGSIWWWVNRGEVVLLFSFIWLLYSAWGAGPYSVDALLRRSRGTSGARSPIP